MMLATAIIAAATAILLAFVARRSARSDMTLAADAKELASRAIALASRATAFSDACRRSVSRGVIGQIQANLPPVFDAAQAERERNSWWRKET